MGADPNPIRVAPALPQEDAAMRLCREIAPPSVAEIAELIKNRPDSIEAGLVSVDFDLFIPSVGEIDLVAVSKGRLTMVSIFSELTADHLGKAAGIRQWTMENATVLKRVYLGESKEEFSPRILFLCSDVDQRALLLMKMIADLPLEICRYRCLESGENKWLAVEKVAVEKPAVNTVRPQAFKSRPALKLSSLRGAELTTEEIGDFFEGEADLDTHEFGDIVVHDETTFPGPYFNS